MKSDYKLLSRTKGTKLMRKENEYGFVWIPYLRQCFRYDFIYKSIGKIHKCYFQNEQEQHRIWFHDFRLLKTEHCWTIKTQATDRLSWLLSRAHSLCKKQEDSRGGKCGKSRPVSRHAAWGFR